MTSKAREEVRAMIRRAAARERAALARQLERQRELANTLRDRVEARVREARPECAVSVIWYGGGMRVYFEADIGEVSGGHAATTTIRIAVHRTENERWLAERFVEAEDLLVRYLVGGAA